MQGKARSTELDISVRVVEARTWGGGGGGVLPSSWFLYMRRTTNSHVDRRRSATKAAFVPPVERYFSRLHLEVVLGGPRLLFMTTLTFSLHAMRAPPHQGVVASMATTPYGHITPAILRAASR